MKYLSNVDITGNCWDRCGIEYSVFMHLCFVSLFLMQSTTENLTIWKSKPQNTHEKFRNREVTTKAKQHNGTRHTRHVMARDLENIAHSFWVMSLFKSQKRDCMMQIVNRKRKKRVKYKLLLISYFFISSITCCWHREPQK